MKPLYKGMLATFSGVLFGSLVALAVQQVWVLGALFGGIASAGISAYILFDAKELLVAIPKAWEQATSWRPSERSIEIGKSLFFIISFCTVVAAVWTLVALWFSSQTPWTTTLLLSFTISFTADVLIGAYHATNDNNFLVTEKGNIIWRDVRKFFIWQSPLFIFGVLWCIPVVLRWTLQTALPTVRRLTKALFILIHCRDRAMCMVDASLGMVAAFLAQQQFMGGGPLLSVSSILVGGIAGTVLFFFNREVVAIRWLKVQPNGSHA